MAEGMRNLKLTTLTRVVILIALYFVGGLVGRETSFLSGSVALVWPPAGIALAAILLFGYRFWPGVAPGAILFSFMNGMPLGFFTLGTAIGKTTGKELKTVLVIDDEPAILELLTKTLLQKGFRVLRTADGRTGVEFATKHLPDVIILDFTLPQFSGTQIVEQLRAHPRTKNIPILINTGTVLNEEERQRLAGHVQSITSKTERENLLSELERLGALSDETVATGAGL
jgi:CheY-like chemotaxis protein